MHGIAGVSLDGYHSKERGMDLEFCIPGTRNEDQFKIPSERYTKLATDSDIIVSAVHLALCRHTFFDSTT
jgi:hypothetical protein